MSASPASATAAPPLASAGSSAGSVPGTVAQALILSRYQLRDYLRSRRFVLMMGIVAAIGAILSLVLYHFHGAGLNGSPDAFYGSLWAGGVTVVVIFSGIIFGGDAIAGEFQNRTGYFLMGLPIRRTSVYAGKYLAALAASLVAVLFYFAIVVANGTRYLGSGALPSALIVSLGITVLYLLALLGYVFLFSSLFKNSLYAVLVVAVLFLFGFTIVQALVVGLVKIEPWFLITYAQDFSNKPGVIAYPFLSSLPPHIVRGGPIGGTTYNVTYPEGIAILVGYWLATAIGGLVLFEREEFS